MGDRAPIDAAREPVRRPVAAGDRRGDAQHAGPPVDAMALVMSTFGAVRRGTELTTTSGRSCGSWTSRARLSCRSRPSGFSLHVRRAIGGADAPGATAGRRPELRRRHRHRAPPEPGEQRMSRPTGWSTIAAPMLGTFYRAEGPGRRPFVEVGSAVGPDTTVCIIEVMKMMNSVPAGVSRDSRRDLRGERASWSNTGAAVPRGARHEARVHRQPRRDRAADRPRLPSLGLETVVGASDVDRDALAARSADRAVCIGPGPGEPELPAP